MVRLQVRPKELLDLLSDPQRLSWRLLGQVADIMAEEEDGEDAESNLALAVIEEALDWRIGLAVRGLIRSAWQQYRKIPKPFILEIDRRSGDIWAVMSSGRRQRVA